MDPHAAPSPCYVIDMGKLRENLEILNRVQQEADCKIILALKGFATFSTFPLIRRYLSGTTASSVNEALLGHHEFGKEVHVYAPAYTPSEIEALLPIAHHISFNSFNQYHTYKQTIEQSGKDIRCGLRINPEYSEVEVEIYNPCASGSRLGIRASDFEGQDLAGISGLHFHTLCEQNADTLVRTLEVVEKQFSWLFPKLEWINFGGGHHITRKDYGVDLLIKTIREFRRKYGLAVYLEPGEAIALNTGILIAEVLDLVHNEMDIAILDTSATAHMPDVLEMPYRPQITGAGEPGQKAHTYRLGGLTCLAGDVIGDYSFDTPLQAGDRLIFEDMAHYTMVKNTCFNGISLPAIALWHPEQKELRIIKKFSYEDYRNRLS